MEEGYELGDVHCKTDIAVVELENPVDENLVGNDDFTPLYADAAQYAVGSGVEQIGYGEPNTAHKYYNDAASILGVGDPVAPVYWETGVIQDVSPWAYDSLKSSSATKGLAMVSFDAMSGRISGYYPSVFESMDDIVDSSGFSGVAEPYEAGVLSRVGTLQGDPAWEILPRVWLFGGRDNDRFRSDLWLTGLESQLTSNPGPKGAVKIYGDKLYYLMNDSSGIFSVFEKVIE